MDASRVKKKKKKKKKKQVFIWSDQMVNRNSKNHNFVVREKFNQLGLGRYSDTSMPFSLHTLIAEITEKLTRLLVNECGMLKSIERLVDLVMGEIS